MTDFDKDMYVEYVAALHELAREKTSDPYAGMTPGTHKIGGRTIRHKAQFS